MTKSAVFLIWGSSGWQSHLSNMCVTQAFAQSLPEALGQHHACNLDDLWASVSKTKHWCPKATRALLPGASRAHLCHCPAQPCSGLPW